MEKIGLKNRKEDSDDDSNTKDLNKLKANTSLRRKYLKYLKSGGKIGLGLGYFIYRF